MNRSDATSGPRITRLGKLGARLGLASLIALALLPVGVALAHANHCYTAMGYTITCGPKYHQVNDPLTGAYRASWNMTAEFRQEQTGRFDWRGLLVTGGDQIPDSEDRFGDSFIYTWPGNNTVLYTQTWWCEYVENNSYHGLNSIWQNPEADGYWVLWEHVDDCLDPFRNEHHIWVDAY